MLKPKKHNLKKVIIGLTGSFGSGKTTVAECFKAFGFQVIDADKIAHRLLAPGTKTYRQLKRIFGKSILRKNKQLNRKTIAQFVFRDKRLLKELNRLVHPRVIESIKNKISASRAKVIVLDVPLLIESGLHKYVDKIIVVKINRKEQIARMEKKFSFSKADILKRINAQLPLSQKARMADFVIDNSGSFAETRKQVGNLRRLWWKN